LIAIKKAMRSSSLFLLPCGPWSGLTPRSIDVPARLVDLLAQRPTFIRRQPRTTPRLVVAIILTVAVETIVGLTAIVAAAILLLPVILRAIPPILGGRGGSRHDCAGQQKKRPQSFQCSIHHRHLRNALLPACPEISVCRFALRSKSISVKDVTLCNAFVFVVISEVF
jgi:hypothetical protein